jgi:DNA-binding transcriptional LysR family regulator
MIEERMNFDIDCLRSFMVVADTMSVSRAAESVGRSQSTISQQIAKLETQVGKTLLTRRKGRRSNSRVVNELANYLAERLTNAGTTLAPQMAS